MSDAVSKPIVVSLREFVEATQEVVGSVDPNFVYGKVSNDGIAPSCHYVRNGKASCMIGQILAQLGVSEAILSRHEGTGAAYIIRNLIEDGVLEVEDFQEKRRISNFAASLQVYQDGGSPWLVAVLRSIHNLV